MFPDGDGQMNDSRKFRQRHALAEQLPDARLYLIRCGREESSPIAKVFEQDWQAGCLFANPGLQAWE
jgi:hypothetical protein